MPKCDPFKTPDDKPISNAIEKWGDLTDRDCVVAGCAVLDANLTHLLQQRLADLPDIAENFLGLGEKMEGGGASTLSSKAELAALVGLVTKEEASYLKAFMRIRNHFAHRVMMDFTAKPVVKELNKLKCLVEGSGLDQWKHNPDPNVQELHRSLVDQGTRKIGETNLAGRTVFSFSRVLFEVLFWQIDTKNERVKTLTRITTEKSSPARRTSDQL